MRSFNDGQYPQTSTRGSFAPVFPDRVDPIALAAGTLYRHPIPADARYVLMSFDGDVWARAGLIADTIAVPAASAETGLSGELLPSARRIPDGATHLLLVAASAQKGSLAFYA